MDIKNNKLSAFYLGGIALFLLLVIFLTVILLKNPSTTTDLRSKAAGSTLYKSWEFKSNTVEGWLGNGLKLFQVNEGQLRTRVSGLGVPSIINKSAKTMLPAGLKQIKIRVGFNPNSATPTPVPSGYPVMFRGLHVYYYTDKGKLGPYYIYLNGGKYQEVSAVFPELNQVSLSALEIQYSGLTINDRLNFDWIRLSGDPLPSTPVTEVPTVHLTKPPSEPPPPTVYITLAPSITPYCKTGVNSFSLEVPCDYGYRYARFACYDGLEGVLGGPTSCKSAEVWQKYVQDICWGRSNCRLTPSPAITTPTLPPELSPKPVLSVTPTASYGY